MPIQGEKTDKKEIPERITNSATSSTFSAIVDAEIGEGTIVRDQVNLFKCKIGKFCKIESFVYIEEGVSIGDYCKIKPYVFIPTGVTIGDEVFVGPNVTFTNDKYPRSKGEWKLLQTIVREGASIGANSVILPGVTVGVKAFVGAGSVVTHDVPDGATVCGNPARPLNPTTSRTRRRDTR
jgi:acetyltransferase-like isoleucine patch superfamily enzyme